MADKYWNYKLDELKHQEIFTFPFYNDYVSIKWALFNLIVNTFNIAAWVGCYQGGWLAIQFVPRWQMVTIEPLSPEPAEKT